jgi:hypothetical protein
MEYNGDYAKKIATVMAGRYGLDRARNACQRNIDDPLMEAPGRKFWRTVLEHLQQEGRENGATGIPARTL